MEQPGNREIYPDKEWSLFLDRDGVINERIPGGYVTSWDAFRFLPGVEDALVNLSGIFGHVFIVTNQQGVGRMLMQERELLDLHTCLSQHLHNVGISLDEIFYCPHLASDSCACRKPAIGMALQARRQFPKVNFPKSVMVGDMMTDMAFGKNAGMYTVLITPKMSASMLVDFNSPDLASWADHLMCQLKKNTP